MPELSDKKVNLNLARLITLDSEDMLGKTLELSEQLKIGIDLGTTFVENNSLAKLELVDWYGLGGSAVAGNLLQGFGYEPPLFPLRINVRRFPRESHDPRVVASYSGNTVEALQAFNEAKPSQIWFTISSGGKLKEVSDKAKIPHLLLPGGYPPRAAVGYSIGAMIGILQSVYGRDGISDLDVPWKYLESDARIYRQLDTEINPALSLAVKLVDRTPVIYTVDGLVMPSIAQRFNCQLAENSKVWSHIAELPEMAHNEVEAMSFMGQLLPPPQVLFLGSWTLADKFPDPRPGMTKMMNGLGIRHHLIDPSFLFGGTASRMATGLRTMLYLDAVTIFLALLRATDPVEIPKITQLKNSSALA